MVPNHQTAITRGLITIKSSLISLLNHQPVFNVYNIQSHHPVNHPLWPLHPLGISQIVKLPSQLTHPHCWVRNHFIQSVNVRIPHLINKIHVPIMSSTCFQPFIKSHGIFPHFSYHFTLCESNEAWKILHVKMIFHHSPSDWWFQPTPLKNDGVRQWWWHSQHDGKVIIHVIIHSMVPVTNQNGTYHPTHLYNFSIFFHHSPSIFHIVSHVCTSRPWHPPHPPRIQQPPEAPTAAAVAHVFPAAAPQLCQELTEEAELGEEILEFFSALGSRDGATQLVNVKKRWKSPLFMGKSPFSSWKITIFHG